MANPVNKFIYFGSNDEGKAKLKQAEDEAKKRGYYDNKGNAKLSPFIMHCIEYTVSNEKIKKR